MPADFTPDTNYRDMEGNMRTFTTVDHDVKLKISPYLKEDVSKQLKEAHKNLVEEICALPAVSVSGKEYYGDFIERSVEKGIVWKIDALQKLSLDQLIFMKTIAWKNTVKEQYWFEEFTHEDFIEGKWQTLL